MDGSEAIILFSLACIAIAIIIAGINLEKDMNKGNDICKQFMPTWASEWKYNGLGDAPVCIFSTGTYGDFDWRIETYYLIDNNRLGIRRTTVQEK